MMNTVYTEGLGNRPSIVDTKLFMPPFSPDRISFHSELPHIKSYPRTQENRIVDS